MAGARPSALRVVRRVEGGALVRRTEPGSLLPGRVPGRILAEAQQSDTECLPHLRLGVPVAMHLVPGGFGRGKHVPRLSLALGSRHDSALSVWRCPQPGDDFRRGSFRRTDPHRSDRTVPVAGESYTASVYGPGVLSADADAGANRGTLRWLGERQSLRCAANPGFLSGAGPGRTPTRGPTCGAVDPQPRRLAEILRCRSWHSGTRSGSGRTTSRDRRRDSREFLAPPRPHGCLAAPRRSAPCRTAAPHGRIRARPYQNIGNSTSARCAMAPLRAR